MWDSVGRKALKGRGLSRRNQETREGDLKRERGTQFRVLNCCMLKPTVVAGADFAITIFKIVCYCLLAGLWTRGTICPNNGASSAPLFDLLKFIAAGKNELHSTNFLASG